MINAGGSDNLEEKADGMNKPLELHKSIFFKKLTGAILLLAPAASMLGTSRFFYYLLEMAAYCYFEADLGNGLDHNFPSHSTDGILHYSSDLIYFTLLLHFYFEKFF